MLLLNILALFNRATAETTTMKIKYSEAYDIKNTSLESITCSNGKHGLISKHGWRTQEQIPDFPYIGGSSLVEGYDSSHCGDCYKVTYHNQYTLMTAVDHADDGLVMSKQGMDSLTSGQAESLGEIEAQVETVHAAWCALRD